MKMGFLHLTKSFFMTEQVIIFEQIVERGCGIDVHKETAVSTVSGAGINTQTKTFSTYTNDLYALRDWLKSLHITHIAMESTGIYWKPVFNILEQDFEILLVNARHIKNVPGHKTDKKDSRWIAKLLLSGLLKASFIPPRDIRDLRDLFRYRRKLTGHATAEYNRFEKILQDANFKMSSVITDIFGVTGTKLIDALLEDNYNFDELIKLCHGRIKAKSKQLQQALVGKLTAHHKFMLRIIRKSLGNIHQLINEVDIKISEQTKSYAVELELLQTIPGISKITSIALLAEIGADMSKFPTEQHVSSWAGMCPGNNETAGKKKVAKQPLATVI
jgi:transposase